MIGRSALRRRKSSAKNPLAVKSHSVVYRLKRCRLAIAFFGNSLKQVISSFFTLTLNFREKVISSFYLLSILSSLDFFNLSFKGQYEPHWDHQSYPGAQSSWDENQGSRIATWLTYMSQEMSILTKTFVNSLTCLLTKKNFFW